MRAMIGSIALTLLLAGSTTVRQEFRGSAPDAVWSALVAAAQTPQYDDLEVSERWVVTENNVWPDRESGRIEIYRRLDRVLYRPRAEPQRQRRTWRFRVIFEPDKPPSALFVSRGLAVPIQARVEADRYFEDVKNLLASSAPP